MRFCNKDSFLLLLLLLMERKEGIGTQPAKTATAAKTSPNKWIRAITFIALIPTVLFCQMLAIIITVCQDFNSKGLYPSSQKEKGNRCLVFTSSMKREIGKFNVVAVQWRQRNVQECLFRGEVRAYHPWFKAEVS